MPEKAEVEVMGLSYVPSPDSRKESAVALEA
jgi:hypothetical protein